MSFKRDDAFQVFVVVSEEQVASLVANLFRFLQTELGRVSVASNAFDLGCAEDQPAADGPAVLLATATLDGTPVAVFSVAGGDVVVVDVDSCTVVDPEP